MTLKGRVCWKENGGGGMSLHGGFGGITQKTERTILRGSNREVGVQKFLKKRTIPDRRIGSLSVGSGCDVCGLHCFP